MLVIASSFLPLPISQLQFHHVYVPEPGHSSESVGSYVGRRQGCPPLAALRNHRLALRFSAAGRKEVLHAAQAKAV